MITFLILTFFVLKLCSSFSVIHDVNFRHLMTEYFLVCGGDYFCGNISEITGFDIETISNYRDVNICSPCKCDRFCINRGDCCADIYFAKPVLQCVNRTIIQAREDTDRVQQNQRLMVASCPKGVPENVRKSCENSDVKWKLRHQPVVHYDQLIVYKNKFCANCNNVTLYREWAIDINCSKFADFNFLSSLNDVISLAFERKCVIQSTDDNIFGTFRPAVSIQYNVENCISKPYQYAKCNVTGMWVNYDKDIEYACESPFLGEKRMFRNIFCFMCNPSPGKHDKFIDSCNVTGSWNPFDDGLLILCHNLPRSPYTAPFKNVFCFLCNRGNSENKTFLDVNGDMEEFTVRAGPIVKYQYDINMTSFDKRYFRNFVRGKMAMNPSLEDVIKTKDALGIISTVGHSINITNLFNQYVSTFAYADLCPSRQYSVNSQFLSNCTCNPFLVFEESAFKTRTPCLDARLDYPTFCRRELELSGIPDTRIMKTNYLVTKGCFQARSKRAYADGCLRHDIDDVFSVLPLSRNVTWNNSDILVTFDNFYCALCNIHSTEYTMEMNLELDISLQLQRGLYSPTIEEDLNDLRINTSVPWSLEIVCPAILPTSYNVLLGDLLKIAHAQKCRVRYVTDVQKSPLCKDISDQVDHCDKISNWTFPDDDVKWACLNQSSLDLYYARRISSPNPEVFDPDDYTNYRIGMYRNRFCSICKPQHDFGNFSFFLGRCNVTGLLAFSRMPLTDDIFGRYEKGCQMAVRTYYYYPYKNIFCAFCDGTTYTSSATQGVDSKIVKYQRVPGLNWFPIMRNIFSIADPYGVDYVITKEKCEINQVYDAFENMCRNISCFPGKVSKNASCVPLFSTTKMLRYTLALGGHFQFPNRTTEDAMMFLILELDQFIRNSLSIGSLHTEHVYAHLNQPCDKMYSSKSIASVRMYLVVFISETVSRQITEERLLNITVAKVSSANLTAQFRPMKEASRLPLLLHTKRLKNECFVYMNPSTAFTMKPYRPVPVSELLLCPYVVISASEYIYHTETHSLKLKRSGKILHDSSYELQGNDDIIICKEELERTGYFLESTQDFSDLKSLWIISSICSVVSSICLLVAIVTYCIFPSLRTVPGIINAVSMVTLLFSLCCNYAGYLFVLSDEGCAIFGILLHYSWLCVFTTMLINNYHMNRVFIAVLSIPQSSTRSILARYFTCAFGVPLLIISIYIVYAYVDGSMSFLGYGGQRCFILNRVALIVTFILPIALIILTNLVLFILTSITILKTPDVRSNQDHSNNFRIILKMSSITGICWVLRVIDSFLSLSALSYISSILTCSQGIFVFLAFIANSRVWQMYKNKLFSDDPSDSHLNKNSNASKRQTTQTTEGM